MFNLQHTEAMTMEVSTEMDHLTNVHELISMMEPKKVGTCQRKNGIHWTNTGIYCESTIKFKCSVQKSCDKSHEVGRNRYFEQPRWATRDIGKTSLGRKHGCLSCLRSSSVERRSKALWQDETNR